MSSSSPTTSASVQNEINTINSIIVISTRYCSLIIVPVAVVWDLLDIYVFTRPQLRRNPCCMYFLSSSITTLVYILINVPLRLLQMGFNIDPMLDSLIACKFKYFFTYSWRWECISSHCFFLILLDIFVDHCRFGFLFMLRLIGE